MTELKIGWQDFLSASHGNPQEFLSLNLLTQFESLGGILQPGQLLKV